MNAGIEILDGGLGNTIQDDGRRGYRRLGLPLAGAADRVLLACANRLVGNPDTAAAIEIGPLGPRLTSVGGPVRLALAGPLLGRVEHADATRSTLGPWQSLSLQPGETLSVTAAAAGTGYLALAGGANVPLQLGSRSTYLRARLGGVAGRALAAGDLIPCATATGPERRAARPFLHPPGPLRILPGPQVAHFTDTALETLLACEYRVTRETDRMGMRLDGPGLAHRPECGADIVSDGVVPGAIQVPADGRPIVLLADAQTVGGYAKIAVVISADLPRLAQAGPGTALRFILVDADGAARARREQAAALAAWSSAIVTFAAPGSIDAGMLHSANLIGGIVDARNPLPEDDPA